MSKKICLIRCPAGLGDILFVQKIGRKLIDKGYTVYWPVIKSFDYIKDYIKGINFITLSYDHPDGKLTENESFPLMELWEHPDINKTDSELFINLHHPDYIWPTEPIIACKYKLVDLDYSDWFEYVTFKRDLQREQKLRDYLGIAIGEKYNVINRYYGSPPYSKPNSSIKCDNGYRNIEMKFLGWDNIFDWCGIVDKAEEIHTVETSLCYIMYQMRLKSVHVYERTNIPNAIYEKPTTNFFSRDKFLDKDWKYYTFHTHEGI